MLKCQLHSLILKTSARYYIFAGVLAHYSGRAQNCHATPQFLQNARPQDEYIQLLVGTQSAENSAIRDIGAVKSQSPGIPTAVYCPQQIRAMSACVGLSQRDIEAECPHYTALYCSCFNCLIV